MWMCFILLRLILISCFFVCHYVQSFTPVLKHYPSSQGKCFNLLTCKWVTASLKMDRQAQTSLHQATFQWVKTRYPSILLTTPALSQVLPCKYQVIGHEEHQMSRIQGRTVDDLPYTALWMLCHILSFMPMPLPQAASDAADHHWRLFVRLLM